MSFMKMFRRAVGAVGGAAIFAAILRVRGKGGVPPQEGGWRELRGFDQDQ